MKTDLVATRVIPILGDPVAQVATPRLWNEVFRQTQTDAICVPIDLPPEGIEDFVSWVRQARNVPGFLTTTPHKAALARACDHLMPDAEFLGVVNTVRRDRDGRLTGDMFDGLGMMDAIQATGSSLKGATVAICGAGAAGSAIALQACRRGVSSLSIFDIDGAKADDLIGRLRYLGAPHLQNGLPPQADILINASYAGSTGAPSSPFPMALVTSASCIADAITDPTETDLLRMARSAGAAVVPGLHMAQYQASAMREFLGVSTT